MGVVGDKRVFRGIYACAVQPARSLSGHHADGRHYDPQGDDGYSIPEYYRTFYCIKFGSGQVVLQHTYEDGKIAAIQISPDELLLAVGLLGVWDIASREVVAERDDFVWLGLPSHVGMTPTLSFTEDSKRLVDAAQRSLVHMIRLSEGNRIETVS
ncbi:hypothetical protein HRG14_21800 [Paenibacillus dendritiformis]|nr:hypothetical protein [Paenibacillus dendritiformis]